MDQLLAAINADDIELAKNLIGTIEPRRPLYLAVDLHRVEIVRLFLCRPDAEKLVCAQNYLLFRKAVRAGNYKIVKAILAQHGCVKMISAYKFKAFCLAVELGHTSIVSLLLLISDKILTYGAIFAHVTTARTDHPDITTLIHVSADKMRNGLVQPCTSCHVFCSQMDLTDVTCSPPTIFEILDAGRDLFGWVLAAKSANLALPRDLVNEIFSKIDPRWQKIIEAMRGPSSAMIGLTIADNLLKKRRFLHRVLASD